MWNQVSSKAGSLVISLNTENKQSTFDFNNADNRVTCIIFLLCLISKEMIAIINSIFPS